MPRAPHFRTKVPVELNTWIRLLFVSATKTDDPLTATPWGAANCPLAVPEVPHFLTNVPVVEKTWMRLLLVSAT